MEKQGMNISRRVMKGVAAITAPETFWTFKDLVFTLAQYNGPSNYRGNSKFANGSTAPIVMTQNPSC